MERLLNNFFVLVFSFDINTKGSWGSKQLQRLILVLSLVTAVRCTVLTADSQRGIHMSRYCPKMEYCAEGTHVMCMYYNPHAIMGPNCGEGQNITITPELVELVLDIVNQIRSTVAKGLETGKNGERLPKAYGMVRLRWDKELATFAQIWANQCTVQHDLCRATKRFSNPSQLVSLVRFTYPDWKLVNDISSMSNKNDGLTMSKLKHTIRTTMKISYVRKNQVTRDMIVNFPDLNKMSNLASVRVFMTMIHTGSTHIGCGISAYADYYGKRQSQSVIVNSVQVVCNFSAQPKAGARVYDLAPAPGSSPTCGCPPHTVEDEDCLCVPRSYRDRVEELRTCSKDGVCTPSVVLLPIVKVENAPPAKLYNPRLGNNSHLRSMEAVNVYQPEDFFDGQLQSELRRLSNAKWPTSVTKIGRTNGNYEGRRFRGVRDRYFDKQFFVPGQRYRGGGSLVPGAGHVLPNGVRPSLRKDSIFTRASKFKLPRQNIHVDDPMDSFAIRRRSPFKKDVKARKDFSNIKNIAAAYLNKKHTNLSINNFIHHGDTIDIIDTNAPTFGLTGLNISKRNFDIRNSNEDSDNDNKLLTLLDKLEEEVKHIDLNNNIKEMIDVKIRKIYGNVVGDHNLPLKPNTTVVVEDLIKTVEKRTDRSRDIWADQAEVYVPEVELATPQRRHQNSLKYEKSVYEPFSDRDRIFDKKDREPYRNLGLRHFENDDARRRGYSHFSKIKSDDYYLNDDDPLGVERRKYYQQKLDNIERKLKSIRGYSHHNEKPYKEPYFRPIISPNDVDAARLNNRVDNLYIPAKAKFLHGF